MDDSSTALPTHGVSATLAKPFPTHFPWGAKLLGPHVAMELEKVVYNDPSLEILGPIEVTADSELLQEITLFRERIYGKEAAHLLSSHQEAIERRMRIDVRSLHFVARHEGEILATVRVCPPPFELGRLSPKLRLAVRSFKNYAELGRLVVGPNSRGRGVGKKLLYLATLTTMEKYSGFIAICRPKRAEEFRRFGMTAYRNQNFDIPSRPDAKYKLMWADWKRIVWGLSLHYGRKRLFNWV